MNTVDRAFPRVFQRACAWEGFLNFSFIYTKDPWSAGSSGLFFLHFILCILSPAYSERIDAPHSSHTPAFALSSTVHLALVLLPGSSFFLPICRLHSPAQVTSLLWILPWLPLLVIPSIGYMFKKLWHGIKYNTRLYYKSLFKCMSSRL